MKQKSTASREQNEMPQMAVSNPRQGDGQIYMKTNCVGKSVSTDSPAC